MTGPSPEHDPDATIPYDMAQTQTPQGFSGAGMTISRFIAERGLDHHVVDDQSSMLKSSLDLDPDSRYQVDGLLAEGKQGTLLNARDLAIRRQVTMKIIPSGDASTESAVARFIEEGQLTGQLEHPNIVPVHEVGINQSEQPYYALKRIEGRSLEQLLEEIRGGSIVMMLPELLEIFTKVCQAIAYAHDRGVIHRDLQPGEIMIGDFGEVLVVDWATARVLGQPVVDDSDPTTPHAYLAPEQAVEKMGEPDARADIYALGAILYEILTLRPPLQSDDTATMLKAKTQGDITPPALAVRKVPHTASGHVPQGLSAVAMKALSPMPDDRYASVTKFSEDIERWANGFAPHAENANLLRQVRLIVQRHRSKAMLLLSSAIIAATLGIAFTVKTRAARNVAVSAAAEAQTTLTKQAVVNLDAAQMLQADARLSIARLGWEDARNSLLAALELAPNQVDIQQDLSRVRAASGDLQGSLELVADEETPWADLLRRTLETKREHDGYLWPRHLEAFKVELGQIGEGPMSRQLQHWINEERETRVARNEAAIEQFMRDNPEATRPGTPHGYNLDLTGGGVRDLSALAHYHCTGLSLQQIPDIDLLPLRHLPLRYLRIINCPITDLSALKGMKLELFRLAGTSVKDLSPVVTEHLRNLTFYDSPVTSIEPLRGIPLDILSMPSAPVSDLSPLIGTNLQLLNFNQKNADTASLAKIPLNTLQYHGPELDLAPLTGWGVEKLIFHSTATKTLSPEVLLTMPNLKHIEFGEQDRELTKVVISMPQLKTINGKPAEEMREILRKKIQGN